MSDGYELDDEQTLQVAAMAEAAAPFLNFHMQMHTARTLRAFRTEPYENNKAIMQLKAVDIAVQQMHGDFRGIIAKAQRITAERQAQNDPNRKAQKALDKQGFGLV